MKSDLGVEMTLTVEREDLYQRIMGIGPYEAEYTFEKYTGTLGPRCLWGWRKGYVQVGSPEDEPWTLRLSIPNVRFTYMHIDAPLEFVL
jgi:hypothetical protein